SSNQLRQRGRPIGTSANAASSVRISERSGIEVTTLARAGASFASSHARASAWITRRLGGTRGGWHVRRPPPRTSGAPSRLGSPDPAAGSRAAVQTPQPRAAARSIVQISNDPRWIGVFFEPFVRGADAADAVADRLLKR